MISVEATACLLTITPDNCEPPSHAQECPLRVTCRHDRAADAGPLCPGAFNRSAHGANCRHAANGIHDLERLHPPVTDPGARHTLLPPVAPPLRVAQPR